MDRKILVILAAVGSVLAGSIHASVIAGAHSFLPFGFLFFALTGLLQIAWGVWFFLNPTPLKSLFGFFLNGGVFVLWALARIFPAPFSTEPEQIVPLGVTVAILQVISLATSFIVVNRMAVATRDTGGRYSRMVTLPAKLFVMAMTGTVGYFSAHALQPLYPEVSHSQHHGEGHHGHHSEANADDEHHNEHEEHLRLMDSMEKKMPVEPEAGGVPDSRESAGRDEMRDHHESVDDLAGSHHGGIDRVKAGAEAGEERDSAETAAPKADDGEWGHSHSGQHHH